MMPILVSAPVRRSWLICAFGALLLTIFLNVPAAAQSISIYSASSDATSSNDSGGVYSGFSRFEIEKLQRMMNVDREKTMKADAAKLLSLTEELNTEIAANGSAALTSSQVAKLGEIEKLAKKIKQKMNERSPFDDSNRTWSTNAALR